MTPDEQLFADLLDAWADAIVANDPDAIGRFAEPDWVMVSENGIFEREQFLDAVATGQVTHSWMAFDVHRVRVDGDVATVIVRGRNHGTLNSKPFTLDEWTTEVFVRRDDGWKCAVTHLTSATGSTDGASDQEAD
jgi:ketosteroid isomerase-like protein